MQYGASLTSNIFITGIVLISNFHPEQINNRNWEGSMPESPYLNSIQALFEHHHSRSQDHFPHLSKDQIHFPSPEFIHVIEDQRGKCITGKRSERHTGITKQRGGEKEPIKFNRNYLGWLCRYFTSLLLLALNGAIIWIKDHTNYSNQNP